MEYTGVHGYTDPAEPTACPRLSCDRRCGPSHCSCPPCSCAVCASRSQVAGAIALEMTPQLGNEGAPRRPLTDAEAYERLKSGETYAALRRRGDLPEHHHLEDQ